jgi:hypothetical protein
MQRKLVVLACLFAWNIIAGQQYSFVRFTLKMDCLTMLFIQLARIARFFVDRNA